MDRRGNLPPRWREPTGTRVASLIAMKPNQDQLDKQAPDPKKAHQLNDNEGKGQIPRERADTEARPVPTNPNRGEKRRA